MLSGLAALRPQGAAAGVGGGTAAPVEELADSGSGGEGATSEVETLSDDEADEPDSMEQDFPSTIEELQ